MHGRNTRKANEETDFGRRHETQGNRSTQLMYCIMSRRFIFICSRYCVASKLQLLRLLFLLMVGIWSQAQLTGCFDFGRPTSLGGNGRLKFSRSSERAGIVGQQTIMCGILRTTRYETHKPSVSLRRSSKPSSQDIVTNCPMPVTSSLNCSKIIILLFISTEGKKPFILLLDFFVQETHCKCHVHATRIRLS